MPFAANPGKLTLFYALLLYPALAAAQNLPLSFTPLDAGYSNTLDRIVMVSASPNQLHIYNPASGADGTVTLPAPPLSLSISPDGRFAAVGHHNLISYVDLAGGAVQKTLTVGLNVSALVLSSQYIYIPPTMSIRISDGAVANPLPAGTAALPGQLGPDGAIYTADVLNVTRRLVQEAAIGEPRIVMAQCSSPALGFLEGRMYNACGKAQAVGSAAYSTALAPPEPTFYKAWAAHPNRGLAGITDTVINGDVVDIDNTLVDLFSNAFPPAFLGRFYLPGRLSGRWIFFNNAGDALYVIGHAASAFAVFSTPMPPSPGCPVTLASNSVTFREGNNSSTIVANPMTAPAAGGYFTVELNSAADCLYEAVSAAAWLVPRTRVGGSGGRLSVHVRPNTGSASRTGALAIGTLSLTLTQTGAASSGATSAISPLSFRAIRAVYSKSLDKFVLTSVFPNELHIYDPVARTDEFHPLSFVPSNLVMSPDGYIVGVGGAGVAKFFNLRTGSNTRVYETGLDAALSLLTAGGYAHLAAPGLPSIDIRTGAIQAGTEMTGAASGASALVPPSYRYAYAYLSGGGIGKLDFGSSGSARLIGPAGNLPPGSVCLPFWYSESGTRLYDCKGAIYDISDSPAADLARAGQLSGFGSQPGYQPQLPWLAHSAPLKTVAAVFSEVSEVSDAYRLQLFGEDGLSYLGQQALPQSPQFVSWNSAADRLYAVLRFHSFYGGESNYPSAVYTIAAANGCATPGSGAASFGAFGGLGQVAVNAACAWKASTATPWLALTSGGFGIGSATLGYSVARNDTGTARSGSISFGDRSFTVTQAGAGALTLSPATVAAGASGGAFAVNVTTSPAGVSWMAVSNSAWISVVSGASGAGNGTVSYTVAPNASTSSRTGSINIGGSVFTVNQAAAGGPVTLDPSARIVRPAEQEIGIAVTTAGNWLAVAENDWIRIVSPPGGAGSGSGALRLGFEPNLSGSTRYGFVAVNGERLYLIQYAAQFRLTPNTVTVGPAAGTGTISVEAFSSSNRWSVVVSLNNWITATGSGTGSGVISYHYEANTSHSARTARIYLDDNLGSGYSVGVTQAAPLLFVPVAPCRIADTREHSRGAAFGSPALAAGGIERAFPLPQSPCGIPATAKAYSLNVTVVPRGPLGYLTIWPTGEPRPFVSTLNSLDGRVKANAAVVAAGTGGAISVAATGGTELVLDINGYFIESSGASPAGALALYPVQPCRVADTRNSAGTALAAGASRSFPVRGGAGNCGVPASAQAYSLNATVVPSGPLGYITIWPTGQAQPLASTLNAPTGAIVANAAILPAGSGGEVSVFASGATHVVLDINGYFAPPGLPNARRFYPIAACRALDTRQPGNAPIPAQGGTRSFMLSGPPCALPATAAAYSLNATVLPQTTLGYLTLWPSGQPQPLVSTLNAADDPAVANAAIVSAGPGGAVSAYATGATHLILDVNGYFAP